MGWFDKKETKPADISAKDAAKMSPRKILAEIKKGRTVTGFDQNLAEHLGSGEMKNKPVKDIDKDFARRGSFDHEGAAKKALDMGHLRAGLKGGSGRQVARPLSETMHPAAYRALVAKEAAKLRRRG